MRAMRARDLPKFVTVGGGGRHRPVCTIAWSVAYSTLPHTSHVKPRSCAFPRGPRERTVLLSTSAMSGSVLPSVVSLSHSADEGKAQRGQVAELDEPSPAGS